MELLQILALVAFLCAAVLSALAGRVGSGGWPLALVALGLAGWLVSTTTLVR